MTESDTTTENTNPDPAFGPSEKRRLAKDIFLDAIEIADVDSQAQFISHSCNGDASTLAEVRRLLASHFGSHTADGVLEMDFGRIVAKELGRPENANAPMKDGECHYELGEELGRGGFGIVFQARQTTPVERDVAIKVLRPEHSSKEFLGRFEREQRTLSLMDHPNIARVLDSGTDQRGRPFFAMELVRGTPLTDYCDAMRLSVEARLRIFMDVCRGIQHAHQKGIVHKDLKPENVLVCIVDGQPLPKIIDFGIAKSTAGHPQAETRFTKLGQLLGSPAYMSPEQADTNSLDVDTRSDQYSLGVLLYELLTGKPPFSTDDLVARGHLEMLRCVRETEPCRPSTMVYSEGDAAAVVSRLRATDPRKLSNTIRGDLDWIVMKCLEKDRERRYENVSELIEDIDGHLSDQPIAAGRPSVVYRLRKFVRRNRVIVTSISVATLMLIAGVIGTAQGLIRTVNADRALKLQLDRTRLAEQDEQRELSRVVLAEASIKRELTRANEVKKLTMAMLTNVRPEQADGKDTALLRRILTETSTKLDCGEVTDERIELEMRRFVAESFQAIGRFKDAERHLLTYREKLRALGASDGARYAWSSGRLGEVYAALGKLDLAEKRLADRFADRSHLDANVDADTLRSMKAMGDVCLSRQEYAEANSWYSKVVVATTETKYETQWLNAKLAIANVFREQKKHKEAEELYKEIFDLKEHSAADSVVSNIKAELGQLYLESDRFTLAKRVLGEALEVQRRVLGDEHPGTLESQSAMGEACRRLRDFKSAEAMLVPCYEIQCRVLGPDQQPTLQTLEHLCRAYLTSRQYKKAEPCTTALLKARRRTLGNEHSRTLNSIEMLGQCYTSLGQPLRAEPLIAEALAVRRRTLGADHSLTLSTQQRLATCYYSSKNYDKARPVQHDVFERRKRVLGPTHKLTLSSQVSQGLLAGKAGTLAEAESTLTAVIQALRDTVGPNHTNTLLAERSLIAAYRRWKHYAKALPVAQNYYECRKAELGNKHLTVLQAQRTLGELYLDVSAFDSAETTLVDTVRIHREVLGDAHSQTALAIGLLHQLGANYLEVRSAEKAKPLLLQSFEVRKQTRGLDYPNTLSAQNNLGLAHLQLEEFDQANTILVDCVERCERVLGVEHWLTMLAQKNLASVYVETAQFELAEKILTPRLAIQEQQLGNNDKTTKESKITLSYVLARLKQYQRVIALCEDTLPWQKEQRGWAAKGTFETARLLAHTYCSCRRYDQSESLYLEILAASREFHGERDEETLNTMSSLAATYIDCGRTKEAVKLAKAACDIDFQSGKSNARRLQVLASAYFADGDLAAAIRSQQQVVDCAPGANTEARLQEYQAAAARQSDPLTKPADNTESLSPSL